MGYLFFTSTPWPHHGKPGAHTKRPRIFLQRLTFKSSICKYNKYHMLLYCFKFVVFQLFPAASWETVGRPNHALAHLVLTGSWKPAQHPCSVCRRGTRRHRTTAGASHAIRARCACRDPPQSVYTHTHTHTLRRGDGRLESGCSMPGCASRAVLAA